MQGGKQTSEKAPTAVQVRDDGGSVRVEAWLCHLLVTN